ncbi:MAG: hypothetical protein ACLGI6_12240 [Gammaproteobacteria bacterium]
MKATFSIIVSAARAALQWRLLLCWAVLLLIPTLFTFLPVWRLLANNLDHSVHAARLAQALDLITLTDLKDAAVRERPLLTYASAVGVLVTLLLSPLLTGMAVGAARARPPARLRELLAAGWREYPRMLRMLLWALVPIGVALVIGDEVTTLATRRAHLATVEAGANLAQGFAAAVTIGLLLLAQASVDAGRAWMALDGARTSAIASWGRGVRALGRRPLAVLSVYLLLTVVGLAFAALLMLLGAQLKNGEWPGVLGGFLLTQAAVAVLAWMRIARLYAFMRLLAA